MSTIQSPSRASRTSRRFTLRRIAAAPSRGALALAIAGAVGILAVVSPALGFGETSEGVFADRIQARIGGVIGIASTPLGDLPEGDPLRAAWGTFVADHGGDGGWQVYVDHRSGLPTLVSGQGIAWAPGVGNDLTGPDATLADLEARARAFLERHRFLLGEWKGQLELDVDASVQREHVWQVAFRQVVDGVTVEGARYGFVLSHGNLVSFGARRWATVLTDATPNLSAAEARAKLDGFVGLDGSVPTRDLESPELVLIPVDAARADGDLWTGPRGEGYEHRLVWRFRFDDPEEIAIWTGEVDAHDGTIVAFYDDTRYEQIKGHVSPISDDGDCATGGCNVADYPMPFIDIREDGGPVQYGTEFGLYECSTLGSTITTELDGRYFWINDQCGNIEETILCDNELDLGVSTGVNCTGPSGSSPGNTDAARSAYYGLNRVNQKARFWISGNSWLEGKVECRSNVNSTCNATWGGRINMYRAGNGCGNTSRILGVLTHEWGHGFDQNDGGGFDTTSEAYADVVAIFETRESCVGRGFYADGRTCGGYGDTCLTCTGIRDHDWAAREQNTPATPSGFVDPNCGGGGGPCGRQVHCESYPIGGSMWDLATRDLPAAGLDAATSWQVAERLWYQSRPGSGGPIYNCSLPSADSCSSDTWFQQMRAQDDDDGNLANGTPHAAALFAAFDRHDIACGTSGSAENQSTSNCPTIGTPAVTYKGLTNAVELTWDAVAGASTYRVYRNENGCDRGQVPLWEGPETTYLDEDVANGLDVYYRVQAIGANAACEGALSACSSSQAQALAGRVQFDRATYGCSNVINLRVKDENHSSATIAIDVWSDSEATAEVVTLVETDPGSGKYTGSISTTSAAAAADGLLTIANGDTITAEYVDEDDGNGGVNVPRQTTVVGDCVFPVITGVDETGVTGSAATVVWDTNEIADTVLRWGETTPPTQTATGADRVTEHSVGLNGLAECTVYFYQVESTDPAGNLAVDDNGGQFYRFETKGDFGSGLQPCRAGQVDINVGTYSCNDSVSFELVDIDLNTDPLVVESATILLTSSTETTEEIVLVTETGPNTSVFTGVIATALGAPTPDGILQLSDGDVITATYRDSDDGAGFPALSFDTAIADCVSASVSGLQVTNVTQARATFSWTTSEPADTVLEWGFSPALGNVSSSSANVTSHQRTVTDFDQCGDVYFRVSGTDRYGNAFVYDDGGQPFSFRTYDIPGLYAMADFEDGGIGWTLDGEWEVDAPQGLGGSTGTPDPTDAYNNTRLLGHDLTGLGANPGDYEPGISQETAKSPVYNASTWTNTKMILHRRLNVQSTDDASMWLFFNGVGIPLFRNDGNAVNENSFQVIPLDISGQADGAQALQIEFRQSSNASANYSGWNVDDIIFKDGSQPDYAPCGSCDAAPTFAGATSAVDNDACGTDGVTVSWNAAPAWGTGSPGTYAIYRGASPGFTPDGTTLLASGIATLSYNDPTAPIDQDSYYLVRAENDETCGTGPENGGLTDANAAYVGVSETSARDTPVEVEGVLVDQVASTHVRISWPAVADATLYRVYRSASPQPETFALLGETSTTVFEDLGEATTANSHYYQVRALNPCGDEGP